MRYFNGQLLGMLFGPAETLPSALILTLRIFPGWHRLWPLRSPNSIVIQLPNLTVGPPFLVTGRVC